MTFPWCPLSCVDRGNYGLSGGAVFQWRASGANVCNPCPGRVSPGSHHGPRPCSCRQGAWRWYCVTFSYLPCPPSFRSSPPASCGDPVVCMLGHSCHCGSSLPVCVTLCLRRTCTCCPGLSAAGSAAPSSGTACCWPATWWYVAGIGRLARGPCCFMFLHLQWCPSTCKWCHRGGVGMPAGGGSVLRRCEAAPAPEPI